MPIVIDASVTLAWCLPDETSTIADIAFTLAEEEECHVPPIWWYEVRNILVVAERRGRFRFDEERAFFDDLGAMMITVETDWQRDAVTEIARSQNLTVYDAAYLELASRRQATLATLDNKLVQAAQVLSVQVVGV